MDRSGFERAVAAPLEDAAGAARRVDLALSAARVREIGRERRDRGRGRR